jgi:hypothetical protein
MLMIIGLLFSFVPAGSAQSVQDWSEPVNLSMSGAASNPSMVVDVNGVVHVIWVDQFDGFKYVQSADNGVTWSAPVAVKYPFSAEADPPMFFSDARGTIHIFWLTDQNKLSYARTLPDNLDSPPSWRTKIDLDSAVYDFDAGMDPQGRMHVAYVKNPAPVPGTAGVYYKRSADGGTSWAAPKLLYESPYFRSLTAENARIRLAVSDTPEDERVYVVWDDHPQKRIFVSTSIDGGLNWDTVKEMVAPQSNFGFRTPYNADINVMGDKVLATWMVGEPGARCTPYSWSSADGGETWGEQVPILSESAQCPERAEFISMDPAYSVALYTIQGDLSLSAWNGTQWSNPEIQAGPSSITNPATFEPVSLGCERAVPYNGYLFVVGCDQGGSGDIWFISRQLDPLDNLFPLPSKWSGDVNVVTAPRTLSALASVADGSGNVHAVWVQSASSLGDAFASRIEYARWDGSEWRRPSPIITNVGGLPKNLALQIDSQQRLLLSWMNQQTGELVFTWSSAERANIPIEWNPPIVISASSKLIDSPDLLVDATDRIVIAYAITLNEERGIYLTQSTDLGKTWSTPVKVLDAVSENWEMVDQPKLAVSADGRLHILFTRYVLLGDPQSVGLYYAQSADGGNTWSVPELVSEQPVQWSELVSYQGDVHRLWQEQNRLVALTNHQVSTDGGISWSSSLRVPVDSDIDSQPTAFVDWLGSLHFIQVVDQENQVVQEWKWEGSQWQLVESKKVAAFDLNSPALVEGGLTLEGTLYSLIRFERSLNDGIETRLLGIRRSLEISEPAQPNLSSITTPSASILPILTESPELIPTAVPPLADFNTPPTTNRRNIVGFALIATVVIFILVVTLPRRNKAANETRPPK